MTPKEKAKELVNSFDNLARDFTRGVSIKEFSKQCALITINEMINISYNHYMASYYAEVKQEIKNL